MDHFHQKFRRHSYTPLGHIGLHAFSKKVCVFNVYYWKSCIKMQNVTDLSKTTTQSSVLIRKQFIFPVRVLVHILYPALGSHDRASWAKYEDRKTNKMQQLDIYY